MAKDSSNYLAVDFSGTEPWTGGGWTATGIFHGVISKVYTAKSRNDRKMINIDIKIKAGPGDTDDCKGRVYTTQYRGEKDEGMSINMARGFFEAIEPAMFDEDNLYKLKKGKKTLLCPNLDYILGALIKFELFKDEFTDAEGKERSKVKLNVPSIEVIQPAPDHPDLEAGDADDEEDED